MQPDVTSILLALTIGTMTMAVALPAVMGPVGRPARLAQLGAALLAGGWVLLLASGTVPQGGGLDRLLSSLSMVGISGGLAAGAAALCLWQGHARAPRVPAAIGAVMSAGYAIGFDDYAFRVAWSNGLLALQMAWIAGLLARPTALPVGRWRWLLVVALLAQMVVTAWRGALGGFFSASMPSFAAGNPVNVAFALVASATSILSMIGVLLAHRDEAARELVRLATVDGLTHALNRRAWLARVHAELATSARHGHPVALLMIDIDHFKRVNDGHGHAAGDRALQFVAQALQRAVRAGDVVGRYGGEEFCVLLVHADADAPRAFDERLRVHLDAAAPAALGFPLSYSAGVARRLGADDTLEAMLRRADQLLYRAKDEGRGRMIDPGRGPLQAA